MSASANRQLEDALRDPDRRQFHAALRAGANPNHLMEIHGFQVPVLNVLLGSPLACDGTVVDLFEAGARITPSCLVHAMAYENWSVALLLRHYGASFTYLFEQDPFSSSALISEGLFKAPLEYREPLLKQFLDEIFPYARSGWPGGAHTHPNSGCLCSVCLVERHLLLDKHTTASLSVIVEQHPEPKAFLDKVSASLANRLLSNIEIETDREKRLDLEDLTVVWVDRWMGLSCFEQAGASLKTPGLVSQVFSDAENRRLMRKTPLPKTSVSTRSKPDRL